MSSPTPLKFLMPGWFSLVMGLCGLSLAWHSAQRVFGNMADGVALVVAVLAVLVFLVFVVAAAEIAIAIPIVLLLVRHKRSLDLGSYADLHG